jgi:hypothetical protein
VAAPQRLAAGLAAIALAAATAGCGGDEQTGTAGSGTTTSPIPPGGLGAANCHDWNEATPADREIILHDLRLFAGGDVVGPGVQGRGEILTDEQAYQLFDTSCVEGFASKFLLYKLYTHAAVLTGQQPAPAPPAN